MLSLAVADWFTKCLELCRSQFSWQLTEPNSHVDAFLDHEIREATLNTLIEDSKYHLLLSGSKAELYLKNNIVDLKKLTKRTKIELV